MKLDFQKITSDVDEATSLVTNAKEALDKEGAAENKLFYDGEHFNDGKLWTGPQPESPNDPASLAKIKREFASKNVIKEIVKGHRDGVISREPECAFTVKRPLLKKGDVVGTTKLEEDEQPSPAEMALIREANTEVLTNWWNERDILRVLQDFTKNLLVTSRATLRFYIPPAELINGQLPRVSSLEEALSKIYLLSHDYTQAGVFLDDFSMKQVGIFVSVEDSKTTVELTYILPDGRTVIQTISKDKNQGRTPKTPASTVVRSVFSEESEEEAELTAIGVPLGGRLLMHEATLPEMFVSPQMKQSNKGVNKSKTLRGHVLNEAGFPETNLLNAALPGKVQTNPSTGEPEFIPNPVKRGVNVFNSWVGIEYEDEDGKKRMTNPSVHTRDIPSLAAFIESERADYQDGLEESGQAHKLIVGDATANGVSRVQAKGTFGMTLLPTVGVLNKTIRWAGETALTLAAVLMNQPKKYSELRMNADCRVDTGPVLPDEIEIGLTLVEKKIWSRARLQRLTSVEDTEAEDAAILADEAKLEPMKQIQTERSRLNLQKDKEQGSIRGRIEAGANGSQLESGATN